MITKDDVRAGYQTNIIKIIESPNGDGVVCQIGDLWFYFGGPTAEETNSVENFLENIPEEDIIDEIYQTLGAFRKSGETHKEFANEYTYYKLILSRQGIF